MKELTAGTLQVRIHETRMEMGAHAAETVSDRIRSLRTQDEINIIFAAAPSQNEFLEILATDPDIPWEKINAFHMDEYVGLHPDAPQGFGNFLKDRIFGKVPFKSVHYLNGNAADIQAECSRYATLLKEFPTDIVCLGIGENCHLAFNDPHVADFHDPLTVKEVILDHACRQQQVNDDCFIGIDEVPTHALTVTIPALFKSTYAYCIVPGPKKAEAIMHTVEDDIQELYPSTILRTHPHAILFIDEESAGRLQHFSSFEKA